MTLRTARISFVAQYDDEFVDIPKPSVDYINGVVSFPGEVIQTECVYHALPMTGMEVDALNLPAVTKRMQGGGHFAAALSEALSRADSGNTERIVEAFWNLLTRYRV